MSRVTVPAEFPLQPCPFCAGAAEMRLHSRPSKAEGETWVRYTVGCGSQPCRVDVETVYAESQAEAAHYWHDRKQEVPWRVETTSDLVLPSPVLASKDAPA